MKKRICFILVLFLTLTLLFAIQKPFFMWYNASLAAGTSFNDWINVIWHGFSLDMTIAGYITILPTLFVIASIWIKGDFWPVVLKTYLLIFAILSAIIFVSDMALYPYWGYKLNSSIWFYLASPKDAAASLEFWSTVAQIAIMVLYGFLFYFVTSRAVLPILFRKERMDRRILSTVISLVMLGALILPIRGGLHTSVANEGRVYFSSNMFLNHAAVNPCFSLLDSSIRRQKFSETYHYMDDEKAAEIVTSLQPEQPACDSTHLVLNTVRPNIVMVILESFAGSIVGAVGGDESITPNLNAIANDGITFNRFYANSFRTDRGLVSILNAYPAQPASSIMKHPAKSQTLPGIAGKLKDAGYATSIYYGGDIDFTNMRSFFYASGFEKVIGQDALTFNAPTSKWGYDDRVMFDYFTDEVEEQARQHEPFFMTLLTISSHEPFEVPFKKFENPYVNSVAFTDDCLGKMMTELRASNIWDNTLFIFIPDHSFLYPEETVRFSPEQHHIFMIWCGGAVAQPAIVESVGTQTDIAATLLQQLSLPCTEFSYSKNLLNNCAPEFAFYTFNNGFGMVDNNGNFVVYDCTADQQSIANGNDSEQLTLYGKAYLQMLMKDFDNR